MKVQFRIILNLDLRFPCGKFSCMKARSHHQDEQHLTEQLGATGLRLTPQRQQVYDVLLHKRDHPTAEEVFIRAKKQMPEISHATVYNCLDALVKCGLARQVHVDRGATRFCPNMHEHGHFHCDSCERFLTWICRAHGHEAAAKVSRPSIMTSPSTAPAPDCAQAEEIILR